MRIFTVSRCLKWKGIEGEFHFKGHFYGHKINLIKVIGKPLVNCEILAGEDYILQLGVHTILQGGILVGKIETAQKIDELLVS